MEFSHCRISSGVTESVQVNGAYFLLHQIISRKLKLEEVKLGGRSRAK